MSLCVQFVVTSSQTFQQWLRNSVAIHFDGMFEQFQSLTWLTLIKSLTK
jgi:hypothetical protein